MERSSLQETARSAREGRLNVSEIFASIQGEGPFAGLPAVFLRFSGCNLRCQWGSERCDTPYTSWEPEENMLSEDGVVAEIGTVRSNASALIITGGEPTLVANLPKLCRRVQSTFGFQLHLETNGTGPVPREVNVVVCSPKTSDSTPRGTRYAKMHDRFRQRLHPSICAADPRLYLKFVISPYTDLDEVRVLISMIGCPPERVYFMPLGSRREDVTLNAEFVAALVAKSGYRFSTREHILRWNGDRRR